MVGVEVLSSRLIDITQIGNNLLIWLFLAFILGTILMLMLDSVGIAMIPITIFALCFSFGVFNVKTGEYTEYKVTVSDEVTLSDFNSKYELINREGEIYTVKETVEK